MALLAVFGCVYACGGVWEAVLLDRVLTILMKGAREACLAGAMLGIYCGWWKAGVLFVGHSLSNEVSYPAAA